MQSIFLFDIYFTNEIKFNLKQFICSLSFCYFYLFFFFLYFINITLYYFCSVAQYQSCLIENKREIIDGNRQLEKVIFLFEGKLLLLLCLSELFEIKNIVYCPSVDRLYK